MGAKELAERLSVVTGILTVLAFLLTFWTTRRLDATLAVAGILFQVVVPLLLALWIVIVSHRNRNARWAGGLIAVVFALLAVNSWLILLKDESVQFDHFGALQGVGIFYLALILPLTTGLAIYRFVQEHKRCPECVNSVHENARVCHYCGYRWETRLLTDAGLPRRDAT